MNDEKTLVSAAKAVEYKQEFFDKPLWLSTKDTAILLRKFRKDGKPSEGAVRNLVWRGMLKARKWGRRLYFKRADLERLLQNAPLSEGSFGWA
jgi:hypothetical protein